MEFELNTLYKVLTTYKQSLIQILDKIDENVLVAISNYDNTQGSISYWKKFTISMEVVEVLQNLIKMLYNGENTVDRLVAKLAELEQDTRPEKQRRNSNPFCQLPRNEFATISSLFTQANAEPQISSRGCCQHNCCSFTTTSLTNTLVNLDEEALITKVESELSACYESFSSYENVNPVLDVQVEPTVMSESPTFENLPKTELNTEEPPNEAAICIQNENGDEKLSQTFENLPKTELDSPNGAVICGQTEKVDKKLPNEELIPPQDQKVDEKPTNQAPIRQNQKVEEISKTKQPTDKQEGSSRTNRNRVSFKIESPKETQRNPQSLDAATKLMKIPHYDWRKEATRWLESKEKKKDFSLKVVSPKPSPDTSNGPSKKVKEKCAIFDILEDRFYVGQSCVFCHIESPSEFYVRTEDKLFEGLEIYLNEDLNQSRLVVNKYKTKAEAMTAVGNFCFGFLTGKAKWFRVEILDWMEYDLYNVGIQLIDYGERLFCDFKNLKCMTDVYAQCPRMAIKCHLAGIYPDNDAWSKASIDCLRNISEIGRGEKFWPIFVHKMGDSYAVDFIKETEMEHGISLGQTLVNYGLAHQIEISDGADYLQKIEVEEFDTFNEAIAGYDAKDEARLCPFTDSTGRCFKGPACKLEHGRLSKDGITTDKVLTACEAMTKLVLPKAEQFITIAITGYVNICHFYAQIVRKSVDGSPLNEDFINLHEAMNAKNFVRTYEKLTMLPGIGELILCEDGVQWLRGRCVGYLDGDEIDIFLVDFGYKIIKKLKNLKQMKEDFLHVPFQAVECILNSCQERKSITLEQSRKFFLQCMHMKVFKALVMESDEREPLKLQLWDSNNAPMEMAMNSFSLVEPRGTNFSPANNLILSCG